MDPVETLLAWSIPVGTLLMVAVGVFELVRARRRKRAGTPLTATYINEVTAMFYGTKRRELEHRASVEMLRDEEGDNAPPAYGIDLDRGTVILPGDRASGTR
ncbi:DUF6191 domain-containing protein [Amycolatopsis magusensis]|uniref:DUF6191 domain-containing protein n=1 Tax=Amycolatopsis magusensis TaxID=882444 RepID=UPI0024A91FCD|nr:DUF6191 domain-containing protein [Amycolatopsis magusensis]MDI5981109.1 DUF6191 domain-containing protein [Amycolatopsis magusensis]